MADPDPQQLRADGAALDILGAYVPADPQAAGYDPFTDLGRRTGLALYAAASGANPDSLHPDIRQSMDGLTGPAPSAPQPGLLGPAPDTPVPLGGSVAQDLQGIPMEDYRKVISSGGLDPNNMALTPSQGAEIKAIMNGPAFHLFADTIYKDSVRTGKETGGLHVYATTAPDGTVSYFYEPVGDLHPDRPLPPGAAGSETLPPMNPALGRPVLEWHPHPHPSEIVVPSLLDLQASLHKGGVPGPLPGVDGPLPGAFWAVPQYGRTPIVRAYQGHLLNASAAATPSNKDTKP